MIERAIRASVAELHSASQQKDTENALERAIQASVAEAQRDRGHGGSSSVSADDQDTNLGDALRQSLQQSQTQPIEQHGLKSGDSDDPDLHREHDMNVSTAIASSKNEVDPATGNDPELETVIKLSQQSHQAHLEDIARVKAEEEIVVDYIKKRSVLDETAMRQPK